ncbi:NTP transferase domain-containing protein [Methanobrevibacter sp. DSM 116169]|uniref:nucleotidyltransferase family protein n=1 Tax=Methanobrevibacter sp. DSM 116169 TaxID=3242727 RepID=UPI0038FC6207
MVSAVITAAGKNSRMIESQINNDIKVQNKLTLPFKNKTVIESTIENVLSSNVDSCILVLGHFSNEIRKCLSNFSKDQLKIIENNPVDVGLSTSLLHGLQNSSSDLTLCVSGDQPTISSKTFNNLIENSLNSNNSLKTISVLRRINIGLLDCAEGLGMPFVGPRENLIKNIKGFNDNLNPILRKMHSDGYTFYAIKEENDLELLNINTYEDYQYLLNRI